MRAALRLLIALVLFRNKCVSSTCSSSANSCGRPSYPPSLTSARIVGGHPARKHSWPWIVSIRQADEFEPVKAPGDAICAGSLITNRHILTAAHCFYDVSRDSLSNYFVVVGAHYLNDTNTTRFHIRRIRLHEHYDHELFTSDIALLELHSEVNLKDATLGTICLPPTTNATYPWEPLDGIAIGWGRTTENSSMSHTLQQVRLPVVNSDHPACQEQISDDRVHLCAGFIEGGKDTCQGDSGGPLMIFDEKTDEWHIAGITSYGTGCAREGNVGVYTRVSVFIDWINEQMHSFSPSSNVPKPAILLALLLVCFVNIE